MADGPQYVWHYTTAEGLIDIVGDKAIRSTNIFYTNDQKEFRHGVQLAIGELQSGRFHGDYKEIVPKTIEILQSIIRGMAVHLKVYVSCFSEAEDDLSQWRSYCPHGGYAIGFPLAVLQEAWKAYFMRCVYDDAQQRTRIGEQLNPADIPPHIQEALPSKRPMLLAIELAAISTSMKDPAFCSEGEYRHVRWVVNGRDFSTPDHESPEEHFRARSGVIVPYLITKLNDDELWKDARVYVGPCPHMSQSVAAVRSLMNWGDDPNDLDRAIESKVPHQYW